MPSRVAPPATLALLDPALDELALETEPELGPEPEPHPDAERDPDGAEDRDGERIVSGRFSIASANGLIYSSSSSSPATAGSLYCEPGTLMK